jgi:hypothetical protein
VRPEGLSQLKIPITPSGIESATFRQLRTAVYFIRSKIQFWVLSVLHTGCMNKMCFEERHTLSCACPIRNFYTQDSPRLMTVPLWLVSAGCSEPQITTKTVISDYARSCCRLSERELHTLQTKKASGYTTNIPLSKQVIKFRFPESARGEGGKGFFFY